MQTLLLRVRRAGQAESCSAKGTESVARQWRRKGREGGRVTEWEVHELAGWVVTIAARCPDCGGEHEMAILASELVGAAMDCEGVFVGEPWCVCGCCYGMEAA